MKLDARRVQGFLQDPGNCRAVLLHGDDEGLIRERARDLTRWVAGSLNDPFRVAELDREGWPHISAEMTSLAMTGGRRVVRVREVTDAALDAIRSALKSAGDALLVLEAPGLGKGRLRTFLDAASDAVTVACYAEGGRALQDLIRGIMGEFGVSADADALRWIAEAVSGDRAVVRAEAEKLALLAGAGGRVDLAMARVCAGDSAGASADDGFMAATGGRGDVADAAFERALSEGLNGIALLRMAISHLQRLHLARLRMQAGASAAEAVQGLRPPIFFKAVAGFSASLALWPLDALVRAIEEARQVEIACKLTGSRPELLVRRFLAGLARQAAARARG